ncbi:serine/threonine-protein kinase [Streptomyces sp. L7]
MPEPQVRRLGAFLVEALQAIHAANLVHRDLKPANVLLASDGPRVIDFGISRVEGAPSLTQAGIVVGTPPFMSPEQMTAAPVGPPTDVFSLGGVLVYALTGPPFGSRRGGEPAGGPPPTRPGRRTGGATAAARRCLAKRPGDRPRLDVLLGELLAQPRTAVWPPPAVARTIEVRRSELAARRGAVRVCRCRPVCCCTRRPCWTPASTDDMVTRAVVRGDA